MPAMSADLRCGSRLDRIFPPRASVGVWRGVRTGLRQRRIKTARFKKRNVRHYRAGWLIVFAIRCEAQMVRLRVRCAGWHRIQAWKKLIRPTSQNGETNRLTKTSLGRSRSTNSLQSADFIAAEVRFPIFRHCLQVLSSTVSMVKASPGRASCLAPCSASSRVLNRSQSSFESDHRM